MTRLAPLACALPALITAAPAAADPVDDSLAELRAVAGPDLSVLVRHGQPTLEFLGGRLTASPAADVREAGAVFLARHGEALGLTPGTTLELERTVPLRAGAVLRYRQRANGIPVVGGEAALRFDRDGILRTVASALRPLAGIEPPVPIVTEDEALAEVLRLPGLVAVDDPDAIWMGLVYLPAGGEARLAWQVETGRVPALLANWVTWVDARTGEVLARRNRVLFDRLARVFEENPVATPETVDVTLEDLPVSTEDPFYLMGELILARNCVDRHELTEVTFSGLTLNVHLCSEVQVAAGSPAPDHDFLFDDNEDTAPEDLFAEAQMFYHANKVYDFFASLGFGRLRAVPLAATVNFRIPLDPSGGIDWGNIVDPNGELYPFDNAMFLPAGDASMYVTRDVDSIVFGQGTSSDFSYDGDIVYHEFTHAVVDSTCSLAAATTDDQGLDIGPGALNEGYSDIFAMFLTEDPLMGEYGAASLPPLRAIRDLDPDARCPEDMIGEVHQDSLPWSSAAWNLFEAHGAEIVQPYYDAMVSLVMTDDFRMAVRQTVAAIEEQLGAAAADEAQAVFEENNVADCERVVELRAGRRFPLLLGEGTSVGLSPYVPAYMMFSVNVPAGQRQVRTEFTARAGGFIPGTIQPYVLFRQGPDRLSFEYSGRTVESNADYEVAGTDLGGGEFEAAYCISGETLEPGDYFVMIANSGSAGIQLQNISITVNDSEPSGPCVGDAGEDGGETAADVVEDAAPDAPEAAAEAEEAADGPPVICDPVECDQACRGAGQAGGNCVEDEGVMTCACRSGGGGCDCRATGTARGASLVGLLGALGILLARRRARRPAGARAGS